MCPAPALGCSAPIRAPNRVHLANRELQGKSWRGGVEDAPSAGALRGTQPVAGRQARSCRICVRTGFGLLARQDRIALARVGLYGFSPVAGRTLQGRTTITQGLDILEARRWAIRSPRARCSARLPTAFAVAELAARTGCARQPSLASGQFSTEPLLIGKLRAGRQCASCAAMILPSASAIRASPQWVSCDD